MPNLPARDSSPTIDNDKIEVYLHKATIMLMSEQIAEKANYVVKGSFSVRDTPGNR